MRQAIVLLILLCMVLQGCASSSVGFQAGAEAAAGGAAVQSAPGSAPAPEVLERATRALKGQPATLELADGRVVREVEEVTLGPESTSWRSGEGRETVPTAQVRRVIRQVRWRAGKGILVGLAAGIPLGFAISSGRSTKASGFIAVSDRDTVLVATDLVCGLAGMLLFTGLRVPSDRVVYTAGQLAAETASPPLAPGEQRCRLAPAHATAGFPAVECSPEVRARPEG